MTELAGWQTFYEIVGASAGALIGLQFVVMTLVNSTARARLDPQAGEAFATPTILHFGTALGLAGVLSAPWEGVGAPLAICCFIGVIGTVYAIVVARRMRKQKAYQPVFEDWLFHSVLPIAAYIALALAGYAGRFDVRDALFGIGGASLVLLFVGIHNAWDAVTYHVFTKTVDKGRD
jgi:hypothetical protein